MVTTPNKQGLRLYLNTATVEASWLHPLEATNHSLLDCTYMTDEDFEALFVSWL